MLKIHYGQAETLLDLLQTPMTFVFQKHYLPTFDSWRVVLALDQALIPVKNTYIALPHFPVYEE